MAVARVLLLLLGAGMNAAEYLHLEDGRVVRAPKLFQLDDYQECLQQVGGVYCLGDLALSPVPGNPASLQLFNDLQEYSQDDLVNYNHTIVHRGVCLDRCIQTPFIDDDAPEVFEQCVDRAISGEFGLRAAITKLEYCKKHGEERPIDIYDHAFVILVAVILGLNFIGTVYDVWIADDCKGNNLLLAWSVRANWRELTAPRPRVLCGAANLDCLDGVRVIGILLVLMEHVSWLISTTYVQDSGFNESVRSDPDVFMVTNSTMLVQAFFMMSSFFLATKLLAQLQKRQDTGVSLIPEYITARVIRLSPSYWFMWAYAATWAAHANDGPLWAPIVEAETEVCRRKWWSHLLYINNVVDPDNKCLIQTWYLAADMQLYLLCIFLLLVLWRWRRFLNFLLMGLFLATVTLLFALSYYWELKPSFLLHRPELMRTSYAGELSFNILYQSPLGNLAGSLAGLLVACVHRDLLANGYDPNSNKMLMVLHRACAWLLLVWMLSGIYLLRSSSHLLISLYAALEKPMFAAIGGVVIIGAFHHLDTFYVHLLSWPGWRVPARLSYGVLLLHLTINRRLLAGKPTPAQASRFSQIHEWGGVVVISWLVALPLALLVELPCARMHRALSRRTTPPDSAHPPRSQNGLKKEPPH